MKTSRPVNKILIPLLLFPAVALAAGTPSNTNVNNTATLNYQVSGISQTPVTSNTNTFKVDNKVDLVVATVDGAIVTTVPGAQDVVLTYTVTNNGNTTQDFSVAATNSATGAFGETETFNASNVTVFVDVNGNGTYEVATDIRTYVDELAADSTRRVFVVSDMALTTVNNDVASYDVTATVATGGTANSQGSNITTDDAASANNPAVVQIVFADGAGTTDAVRDGKHSSKDGYKIVTATLTVAKADSVVQDPINGGTNPKAIPGARVRYTINVSNSGSSTATNVVVVDGIPTNTRFYVGSVTTTPAVGPTKEYSNDNGATWTYVPVAGGDGSDSAVTHVRVTFSSLTASGSAQAVFDIVIA